MALERGIPAVSAVMGTQRLVFPSNVFDAVHCARCRVPWHKDGGMLLLELNRVLRPGGFFLWSATPVYWKDEESVQIWRDTKAMAEKMSWKLVAKKNDPSTRVALPFSRNPRTMISMSFVNLMLLHLSVTLTTSRTPPGAHSPTNLNLINMSCILIKSYIGSALKVPRLNYTSCSCLP